MLIDLPMNYNYHQNGVNRQNFRQLTSALSFKNASGSFWNGMEEAPSGKMVRSK